MSKQVVLNAEILQAALSGYGSMLKEITRRMTVLERALNGYQDRHRPKYKLTPEARKRISEAQKARWKQYRSEHHA